MAIVWWHDMHFAVDGNPARSPFAAPVWQSRHFREAAVACCAWLNGMGCAATVCGNFSSAPG